MILTDLNLPNRNRMGVEHINRHAQQHGPATARVSLHHPVNRSLLFTSPTLTPLSYSPVWTTLNDLQQRRYNQLCGLMQNELICFFEMEVAVQVLPAMLRKSGEMTDQLRSSLEHFLVDEHEHTKMFRRLNRLAEPDWYAASDYHILQFPTGLLAMLRGVARRPGLFPMVYWIMLMMEERSLMMSRRYATTSQELLDPQFRETYRAHAEDEVRHVQVDWHLLESHYQACSRWVRRCNAKLLEWTIVGSLLKPRRSNVRMIDILVGEMPELAPRRAELVQAVRALGANPGYQQMMYSAETTPISRALLGRLPEMASLHKRLFSAESD